MVFARAWQRILAFLLDYLLIAVYLLLLVLIGVGLGLGAWRGLFQQFFVDPNRSEVSAFLLLVLPIWLYFALCEASPWQATWGKRRMGLCVTTIEGARLSLPRALWRSAVKLLPWELTHACLWRIPGWPLKPSDPSPLILAGLILVWVLVIVYLAGLFLGKRHQTLYDWLAGTCVVKQNQPG